MKKLLILFMAAIPLFLYGQNYEAMLIDGKTWHYHHGIGTPEFPMDDDYLFSLCIDGDTLLKGDSWKKLYYERDGYARKLEGLIREEGRKVYRYDSITKEKVLLYDFAVEVGDKVMAEEGSVYTVRSKDQVSSCDRTYQRIVLSSEEAPDGRWVEGIGNYRHLLRPLPVFVGEYDKLRYVELNGKTIFWGESIYEDSSSEAFFPEGTSWSLGCYDPLHSKSYVVCSYVVKGDTLIEGKSYRNVWAKATDAAENGLKKEPYSLREENGRVYVYYHEPQREVMYYDFNWDETGKPIALNRLGDNGHADYDVLGTVTEEQLTDGSLVVRSGSIVRTIGRVVDCYGGLFAHEVLFPDDGTSYSITSFVRNGVEVYHKDLPQPAIHDCDLTVWVKDVQGKPVVNATISLTDFSGETFQVGTTNDQGKCSEIVLSPSWYQYIRAEAKGYQVSEQPWTAASSTTINFVLEKATPSSITLSPVSYKQHPQLFDLQGRRLNAVPAKGMYIKNGKKYPK